MDMSWLLCVPNKNLHVEEAWNIIYSFYPFDIRTELDLAIQIQGNMHSNATNLRHRINQVLERGFSVCKSEVATTSILRSGNKTVG